MDYELLNVPTPRADELCRDFVRRMDPWWGYVVAGALLTLGCLVISVVLLIPLMPALGIEAKTTAAKVSSVVALVLGLVLAYVIFTRWKHARVARKTKLIRDGKLVTATVLDRATKLDKGQTAIDLDVDGGPIVVAAFNFWFGASRGERIRVLYLPLDTSPHMLAFDAAGRMYSGHIKSVRRR